ncbi:MAG: hypothetical protein HY238_06495 [Acidobacteria bacterium]|nr:hypothetical protein [Acidobacteriota bacterium]
MAKPKQDRFEKVMADIDKLVKWADRQFEAMDRDQKKRDATARRRAMRLRQKAKKR